VLLERHTQNCAWALFPKIIPYAFWS
jgi:hypothetical protein